MREGYLYIDSSIYPTLLAISEQEQSKGLMGVEWPPPVMSFVYDTPRYNQFWMANTPSPLDIVFCLNGKVRQICKGEPYSTSAIGDRELSDLVVEFPHGTIASVGIKLGHSVGIIKPSQEELRRIIAGRR